MAEDATPLVEALVTIIDAASLFAAGRDRQERVHHPGARGDRQAEDQRRARRSWSPGGGGGLSHVLPEALDPLGQRLRIPAERRVRRRFVSAPCLIAGHDAFGQGVLVEVGAQACHSVGEVAHVDADGRALFCPGQLFFTALHAADSLARHDVGAVCHAGLVDIVFPPHRLQRRRWPAFGTVTVSGRASTLTSALWPQASQAALTAWTPFARMFESVIGGPGLERMSGAPIARAQL